MYWADGEAQGDGIGTPPHWFSLDRGQSWNPSGGAINHCLFELFGLGSVDRSPVDFEVTRGTPVRGGLLAISDSDDVHLVIAAQRPSRVSQPSVEVVVTGQANADEPSSMRFVLEASVTTSGLRQRIDLYNYRGDRWVRVNTRNATRNDRVTEVFMEAGAGRFVEPGTRIMRARVSWYDPGVPIAGWFTSIDQVLWQLPPE